VKIARSLVELAVALVALPALAVIVVFARPGGAQRRRARLIPRLVYGPTPIISIKYMSQAMERRGYETTTFVYDVYAINDRSDYDYVLDDFLLPRLGRSRAASAFRALLGPYVVLGWLLFRSDVFHFFFDGGFLAPTPLRFLEVQLLHLAGKRVVVMPYGSDVAVPSDIQSLPWRHGLSVHYPQLGSNEARTRRWIRYFSRRADFIVACIVHVETLPRWDLLTTLYYPIDTETWSPTEPDCDSDEANDGFVTIAHAPNHRALKGTEFLVAACRQLEDEGIPLRLLLLEGVPNNEVREMLRNADIIAEQFFLGYALSALEGMSLGKPVLSNLSSSEYYDVFRLYTGLDRCPIVDTPVDRIKANVHRLVTDAKLRESLGQAGRDYVLQFHSYEPVGRMWELVYRRIWLAEIVNLHAWNPGSPADVEAPGSNGNEPNGFALVGPE
jgi:glycosyltransferase involved in cell wall biosynthesis